MTSDTSTVRSTDSRLIAISVAEWAMAETSADTATALDDLVTVGLSMSAVIARRRRTARSTLRRTRAAAPSGSDAIASKRWTVVTSRWPCAAARSRARTKQSLTAALKLVAPSSETIVMSAPDACDAVSSPSGRFIIVTPTQPRSRRALSEKYRITVADEMAPKPSARARPRSRAHLLPVARLYADIKTAAGQKGTLVPVSSSAQGYIVRATLKPISRCPRYVAL